MARRFNCKGAVDTRCVELQRFIDDIFIPSFKPAVLPAKLLFYKILKSA